MILFYDDVETIAIHMIPPKAIQTSRGKRFIQFSKKMWRVWVLEAIYMSGETHEESCDFNGRW